MKLILCNKIAKNCCPTWCLVTSIEWLRHTHLSLRQAITYLSIISKLFLYHILHTARVIFFQYIKVESISFAGVPGDFGGNVHRGTR